MPCCRCLPPSSLHVLGTFGSPLNWVSGGWGFSRVVATFSHVGGSFNLFMATTGGALMIPSFRISGYLLHVEYISCVIANCGQHQWTIPSLFSIALAWCLTGRKHYQEITIMLLSLYSFLWLFFLLTSSGWFCHCSMWLYFSQGTS